MSQRVKEFVRQSGVEVSNSNSNDDNFARELEETMLRKERERAAGFRTPPRPPRVQVPQRLQQNLISNSNYEPLREEFADVKLTSNSEKMINNMLREFESKALQTTKLNPGMFNARLILDLVKKMYLLISRLYFQKDHSVKPLLVKVFI